MLNERTGILRSWPILLCMVAAGAVGSTHLFRNKAMYGLIHADAQGYHAYLIAGLLEHSFDWEQVFSSYSSAYLGGGGEDFTARTDHRVNKYFVGTAILALPFFLLSCLAAWLLGFPVDGYSHPFHAGAMIGALFYIGIGLYSLARFFKGKGIGHGISMFVAVTCFLASGLFHYSVSEPLMSHAYSFSLFCLFLFTVQRAFALPNTKRIAVAAVIFSLIVLVRPSNGSVLFSLPFIAGGFGPMFSRLKNAQHLTRSFSVAAVILFGILCIQAFMYLLQIGKPIVWAYHGEGFDFTDPQILNVLFSYRKGFFVYTPWAFTGAVGLLFLLLKKRAEGLAAWLFLGLSVYVISSWWSWYYGSSFGMRAMIEYLPFFAYGLAFLMQNSGKAVRAVLIVLSLVSVPVNLIQSYQYNRFILHWDRMNAERYWKVFLRTDSRYEGIFWGPQASGSPKEKKAAREKISGTASEKENSLSRSDRDPVFRAESDPATDLFDDSEVNLSEPNEGR